MRLKKEMRRKKTKMSQKLYVGGLSWDTDESSLREAFERFGEIEEATIVKDRNTDKSRGFGFVTFTESGAAAKAVQEMNGSDLDGRTLTVNEARDREPRGNSGYRRGGGGGGRGGGGGGRGGRYGR